MHANQFNHNYELDRSLTTKVSQALRQAFTTDQLIRNSAWLVLAMRIFVVFCVIGGVAIFVNSVSVSDFKTACDVIDSEAEKRSMYYDGTCIVAREPATKVYHSTAKTMCHDMEQSKFRGHLVHVLDLKTTNEIVEKLAIGLIEDYSIGIEQSDDTSGKDKNWYWLDENGSLQWSADKSIENHWRDGQPDNLKTGSNRQDCGVLKRMVETDLSFLKDVLCTSIRKFWFICQYRTLIGLMQIVIIFAAYDTLGGSSSYATVSQLFFTKSLQEKFPFFAGKRCGYVNWWQVFCVIGGIIGGLISSLLSGTFGDVARVGIGYALIGGFCLTFGARIASGCTSGHGLSGTGMLFLASFIAVPCMFAGAITGIIMEFGTKNLDSFYFAF